MKRLAISIGLSGLGLMSGVALTACRARTENLETVALLFVAGVFLFVVGSGYARLEH